MNHKTSFVSFEAYREVKRWNGNPDDWGSGFYRDVPVSRWVRKARERHIRDLKRAQSDPTFKYYFDEKAADHAVWWIENSIVHWKGKWKGQKFKLSAWQEWDIIRVLFGWRRKSDGARRYRRALMMVARKNGKSTLLAAIALYMLVADGEAGAHVYCAATKEAQAKLIWRDARKFIKHSPFLKAVVECRSKVLLFDHQDGEFHALGKDSDTQDGLDVHCGIIDEYHAHKDSGMLGVLDSAVGQRRQPLIVIISTAGFGLESPCREEQGMAERVLNQDEGFENDEYFAYICTVDDPDKWEEEDEWYKANPELGLSMSLEDFANECKTAKQLPSKRVNFRVKRLNIWMSAKDLWLPSVEPWTNTQREIDWSALKTARCVVSVDLGKNQDLTAISQVFKVPDPSHDSGYKLIARTWHYCPEHGIEERTREDHVPYERWSDAGHLIATPGKTTRIPTIEAKIRELWNTYNVDEVVLDGWNALDLIGRLTDDQIKAYEHGQTMRHMGPPCRLFEAHFIEERIDHEPNPMMNWQIGHAVVVRDGNDNMKLMKNLSADRIDGLVSLVMGVGRILIVPDPPSQDLEVWGM